MGVAVCRRILLAKDRQRRAGGWNNRFKNAWEPVFHFCRQPQIKFRPEAVGTFRRTASTTRPNNPKSRSGSGLLGTGARGAAAGKTGAADDDGRFAGMARPSNVIEVKSGIQPGLALGAVPARAGRVLRQGVLRRWRHRFRSLPRQCQQHRRGARTGSRGLRYARSRQRTAMWLFAD